MIQMPQVQADYFPLKGGIDLETPPIEVEKGKLRSSLNVECATNGGYTSSSSRYERFSGQPAPSSAVYQQLPATITGAWAVNNTVTGVTSGKTAVLIGSNATGFIITKSTGAFTATEALQVAAVTIATCTATNYAGGAATPLLAAQYQNAAADVYRADIAAVPGSGSILGEKRLNDVLYVWRNNAGGTPYCDIYKSSATGWIPAIQWEMNFTSGGVTEIIASNTITGETSGATAVIASVILKSGTWAAGTAAGVFVFTSQTGAFTAAETVKVGAVLDLATVTAAAAPSLLYEISFTVGAVAVPAEGATLTQGGVTATLKRLVQTSADNSWLGGFAEGRMIITNPAGGSFASGAATLTGGVTVTLSGAQTAITLAPSGRYKFDESNFSSAAGSPRIYGASGVHRGFEFDGTVLVPLTTGMTLDTPTCVRVHSSHLFFSFVNSAQHSGTNKPYIWSPIFGASELSVSDTITDFQRIIGESASGAMAILTRNSAKMLYGSSSLDWQLVTLKEETGAYAHTTQHVGQPVSLDDRGIVTLGQSQVYGNFEQSTLSKNIRRWLLQQKNKAIASMISREKNQYRLFFTDGYALYVTFDNNKVIGMAQQLMPKPATCCTSDEWSDGTERMFFGASDGFVYELDKGTSHDGDAIQWYFNTTYNHEGSPATTKRWRTILPELKGEYYAEYNLGYSLEYGSTSKQQPATVMGTLDFILGMVWGSFIWGQFIWGGRTLAPNRFKIGGTSTNISLAFSGNFDYIAPFTVTGITLQYTPRRRTR